MADLLPERGTRKATLLPIERPAERLAACLWTTGIDIANSRTGEVHSLDPAGADLSGLQGGRGLVLAEHDFHSLDAVLGAVEEAWLEDAAAHAVLRFATTPRAELAWRLIQDRIPIGVSVSYRVEGAELSPTSTPERPSYVVHRWTPFEISLAPFGHDPRARVHVEASLADIAALRDAKRAAREGCEQVARLAALRADAWQSWASGPAAAALAAEMDAPPEPTAAALGRLVDRHLAALAEAAG